MQRDLNIVQVIGTITTTIEVRQNAKGRTFGQFQVASTRTVIYGQEKRQETETFSIVVCDGLAHLCQQSLHIGSRLFAEGRQQTKQWIDNQGQKRNTIHIVVSNVVLLDAKPNVEVHVDDDSDDLFAPEPSSQRATRPNPRAALIQANKAMKNR